MPASLAHVRPQPIARFDAWRIGARGVSQPLTVTDHTLADAIADACRFCAHKDTFVIRENDGEVSTVRFYAVKQKSQARYVTVAHVTRRVHDLYADEIAALQVSAFAPIEPWQWTPGADVVGLRPAVLS